MKNVIGIILIVVALGMAYMGYTKVSESTASAEILGVEISASDESGRSSGFTMLGIGAACLIGGIYLVGKKS